MLSIPQLENDGYVIDYNTKHDWVVTTPEGKNLLLNKDAGMCEGIPYLDIRENHDSLEMIHIFCEKFGLFTEKKVEKSIAARDM